MLVIERATLQDAEQLAEIQKRTFDRDILQFLGVPNEGPPGYDSVSWQQEMMKAGQYFRIKQNRTLIGGFIIFPLENAVFELGRIFIDPEVQNKGYGQKTMEFIFRHFAEARQWVLDTPSWALRNHHFYKKMGFVQTGQSDPDPSGQVLYLYKRTISDD